MDGERSVDDVTLRRASEDDLPHIERLFAAGSLVSAGDVRSPAGLLVAEVEGTIAGFIGLETLGGDGLLRAMCIGPDWSPRDVGRLLVEAILTEGALQALDAVYLFTQGAEPFFARFGFLVIHREEVPSAVRRWAEVHGRLAPAATAMRVKLIES